MKINLTQGQVTIIDDSDAELVLQYKWCAHRIGNTYYAASCSMGKFVYMHRLLLPGSRMVDHIDGNGLNNRRSNIRRCDSRLNQMNRRYSGSMSGYKGVEWYPQTNRWRVRVGSLYVGYFKDPVVAARAYDSRAREIYGGFATLNFPRKGENGIRI